MSQNSYAEHSLIAYIIVTWNNASIIEDCIKSINEQDYQNRTIILVDNASYDDTVSLVEKNYPEVDILQQNKNLGFAKGNNIGISKALEDSNVRHVVLLNSDARLSKNWTSTVVDFLESKPKAATLQSITVDYYDHNIIDSSHIFLSVIGQGTQGSYRKPINKGFDVAPQKIFGCNAAAMLITRAFIEAQPFKNFFDETLYMYLEDVDVALRATVMGWDNYLVPGTKAYHMGSASSKKSPNFSLYMTFRNNLGVMVKNLPAPILFKVLFMMPKSDRASILHLRRIGKSSGIPSIIRGRITSLKFLPIFISKRYRLKRNVKVDTEYLWHLMRRGF